MISVALLKLLTDLKKLKKIKMKKKFYLNIQSKGGSGKSMLTYLQALKNETNEKTCFIDLDSSTKTSTQQIKFIQAHSENRLLNIDMFDNIRKIEREKIFEILAALNNYDFDEFYIDFGAPESEQLPALLNIDFTIDEFKEFEKELGADFIFNVIMAGGPAYMSCFKYLKEVTNLVDGKFELNILINDFTFSNYPELIDELKAWAKGTKGKIKDVKQFGAILVDRSSGQKIIDNVKLGLGLQDYTSFTSKTILKRELKRI